MDRFPNEAAAVQALFIVADLAHDDGALDLARRRYRRVIALRPGSDEATIAYMRLAGIAYTRGDHEAAAELFEELRRIRSPGHVHQRATYWAGRAYLAAKDTTRGKERLREALRMDPLSYYGDRAAHRLGEASRLPEMRAAPATAGKVDIQATGGVERLDILRELELSDAAALESDRLKRHLSTQEAGLYALAEVYHQSLRTSEGIRLGREILQQRGAWDARLLRIVYPFPFMDAIVRESRRNGIDPYLVAGLIRQESMFNPRAVSAVGAIGVMQIMPATGRSLGRGMGIAGVDATRLRDPELNIRLGARYIADLLKEHGGNVTEMLAAYNAGPTRVERWRRFPERRDIELFAERIPFAETREYVRVVQQNARIYETLYGALTQACAGCGREVR